MSDDALRVLEREWRASGADAELVAWLVARTRHGETLEAAHYLRLAELDPESAASYLGACVARGALDDRTLALAACCDHAPARLRCPRVEVLGLPVHLALELGHHGGDVALHVALPVLRLLGGDSAHFAADLATWLAGPRDEASARELRLSIGFFGHGAHERGYLAGLVRRAAARAPTVDLVELQRRAALEWFVGRCTASSEA